MEEVKSEKLYQVEKEVIISTSKDYFYPVAHKSEQEALDYHSSDRGKILLFKTKITIWEKPEENNN